MELAIESPIRTLFTPNEHVASMSTDVVEATNHPVFSADDEDRGITNLQIFHQEIAGPGNLFHPAHVKPHTLKDVLSLQFKILLRRIGLHRYWPSPGFRVLVVPPLFF
jgi:hypothetical protein